MKVFKSFWKIIWSTYLVVLLISFIWNSAFWLLFFLIPITLLGAYDYFQKKHSILRNYPVIGRLRFLLEKIRPEIMQYFVETDTEGRPLNRVYRSLIYKRSKNLNDTTPFGTELNVYKEGYEWINQSIYIKPLTKDVEIPRVLIGEKNCTNPYSASLLNISAMSFGALSKNAILALNKGAKMGGFYHNTGEGGASYYHLKQGGDIVWQIGTGYFGCRTSQGNFDPKAFKKTATLPQVKMIEIKISQGAKPGHGGVLPAVKNTEEIAKIRLLKPNTKVLSPPSHTAFKNPIELMQFIKKLRELSNGKPVGFKLCLGKKLELVDLCKTMISTGITPDFITVDGAEGGTGAAPVEFSNNVGTPLYEGLIFVVDILRGFDLKKDIKVIASGKIISSFHMARVISIGADLCNSARAMMLSIGCIQSLKCHQNTCPVGVATQNPKLIRALDIDLKAERTRNFHKNTIYSYMEILHATGADYSSNLDRSFINKRTGMHEVQSYEDIYPSVKEGCFIEKSNIPLKYKNLFN